jgi:hypothetical protein
MWSTISNRIYIWDYVADFSDFGYMTPYPSWDALAANIQNLAAAGGSENPAVRGLFSEGDDTSMYGDLQELRSYIITRVGCTVRVFRQKLYSRMPLVPTSLLRLKQAGV